MAYNPAAMSPAFLAESRVPGYVAGTTIPFILASGVFFARVYSRALILRRWGWDDTLLLGAWFAAVAIFAIDLAMIPVGIGKHIQTTSMQDGISMLKLSYAVKLVYMLALALTKLAVARFYLRIFPDKLSQRLIGIIMIWIVSTLLVLLGLAAFRCAPISDAWVLRDANCTISSSLIVTLTGSFNIAGDAALIVFVIPKILALQMAPRQKGVLLAIVATSTLVIVAALIRTISSVRTVGDFDQTWVQVEIGIWSVVEVNVGIFCASILAIRPLIRVVYPKLLSSLPFSTGNATDTTSDHSTRRSTMREKKRKLADSSLDTELGGRNFQHEIAGSQASIDASSQHHIMQKTEVFTETYDVEAARQAQTPTYVATVR